MSETDKVFSGSIATLYDSHMVPLLFAPYAADMAARIAAYSPKTVLEIAAGTGAVTAELLRHLPRGTGITATDLNQAMLDVAAAKLKDPRITSQACDAQALPFEAESFDAVICQFGVMFFPDKPKAYSEARRVLRKGGVYALNVWDRIETSPFFHVVHDAVAAQFPDDPPGFFRRTPYGYHDEEAITAALRAAGFKVVTSERVGFPSRAESAERVAIALCQGTPLRSEIEKRAPQGLADVTARAADALRKAFGPGPVETTMQAIVFEASA